MKSFKPTGDYIYDKQVIHELYETKFGIHDHMHSGHVLSGVEIHDKEVYTKGFLYDGYLRTFVHLDIGPKLGISFDDYINKPRYQIEAINRVIEEVNAKKAKANQLALDGIENSKQKGPRNTKVPDLD